MKRINLNKRDKFLIILLTFLVILEQFTPENQVGFVFLTPIIEEPTKVILVYLIIFLIIPHLTSRDMKYSHIVLSGIFVGLFFGLAENIMEYNTIVRFLPTINHALWTSISSIGLFKIIKQNKTINSSLRIIKLLLLFFVFSPKMESF